ncbi:MAG: hypothetical protein ACOYJQ_10210 [Pseudochelatococcus sp.]|uniref:hypothetical protein n=1 Tax=Pseudochelatococcus sp. TaxID=2020869 RepID=UPI003D8F45A1
MQGDQELRWRRFAITLVALVAVLFPATVAALFVLDPYGTGRVTLIDPPGVRAQGTRTEHASRARDQSFDSVIIGNSRMQALNPERLTEMTGARFASLTIPGTHPREQLTLLRWYLRHRQAPPEVILLGTDAYWCKADPTLTPVNPFPFWLYDDDPLVYAGGLARFSVLEEGLRRIQYVFGARDRSRPDGYWDYDPIYVLQGFEGPEKRRQLMEYKVEGIINDSGRFPALDALRETLLSVPAQTLVVFMIPPAFVTGQTRPGTPEADTEARCHAALAQMASARPGTIIIEWPGARTETEDPEDYFDHIHYKGSLARLLEDEIAARIEAARRS